MAKNYNHSAYARNRYASGIVYSGADGVYELTEETFLASDPKLTHKDFVKYKKISDIDYFKQDRADTKEIRHTVPIDGLEESDAFCTESVADEYIRHEEEKSSPTISDAMAVLETCLTKTQKRRYLLYVVEGLSTWEIAEIEGKHQNAIWKSIEHSKEKIKKFLKKA